MPTIRTVRKVGRTPTPVRLASKQKEVIDKLVADGVYKTRSETVRAAVLLLAEKYGLLYERGKR